MAFCEGPMVSFDGAVDAGDAVVADDAASDQGAVADGEPVPEPRVLTPPPPRVEAPVAPRPTTTSVPRTDI